jgi:hypothetical protein
MFDFMFARVRFPDALAAASYDQLGFMYNKKGNKVLALWQQGSDGKHDSSVSNGVCYRRNMYEKTGKLQAERHETKSYLKK